VNEDNEGSYFNLGNMLLLVLAVIAALGLVLSSPQAGMLP